MKKSANNGYSPTLPVALGSIAKLHISVSAIIKPFNSSLEDIFDLAHNLSWPITLQRIICKKYSFNANLLVYLYFMFCPIIITCIAVHAKILNYHSIIRQIEVRVPQSGPTSINYCHRIFVPVGNVIPFKHPRYLNLCLTFITSSFIPHTVPAMLFHSKKRPLSFLYLTVLLPNSNLPER